MSRNQNFLICSIVSIAVLTSIVSTDSRVEARQRLLPLEPNKEYTIAHFNYNHHHNHRHNRHHNQHRHRHPWQIRQQMAREWERIRWQRYQRCINSQFVNRWYCDRILREPNPFRIPRYGMNF